MVHLYYLPRGHVFQLTDVGLVLSFPIHFGHAQIIWVQLLSFTSPSVLGKKSSNDTAYPDYSQELAQNPA